MPLPVLAVFSGVLSKVAAYGFLRIVLPVFPDAAEDFQTVVLLIALASILYGSAQAFTQTNLRLILGYSSMAQLGFITLGIFALGEAAGAQGALLQMVNHGLVVAPLFFIVALLPSARGSEDIREMGGIAFRAPVLAALFLIVALADARDARLGELRRRVPHPARRCSTPRSSFAIIAFTGVALASVYMLRMFIRTMHNRVGRGVESSTWRRDGLVLVPLVLCILAFALYPQQALRLRAAVEQVVGGAGAPPRSRRRRREPLPAAEVQGPKIDWLAISPLVALAGGVVRRADGRAWCARRSCATRSCRCSRSSRSARRAGLAIATWGDNVSVVAGALGMDDLTLALTLMFVAARGRGRVLLSWRAIAPREAGHGEYYALLLTAVLGMVVLAGATNLVTVFVGYELLSIPLYVLCATEMRRATLAGVGAEVPDHRLGRLGDAALRPRVRLRRDGRDRLRRDRRGRRRGMRDDVLLLTGLALVVAGLAFKASVAPFHQWTPDVYEGAPTPVTAFMAVATKAAAFGIILRFFDVALIGASSTWAPALATLAAITIVVGNVGAIGQSSLKRLLAYSSVAQAGYMLAGVVVTTQLGVHGDRLLPRHLPAS